MASPRCHALWKPHFQQDAYAFAHVLPWAGADRRLDLMNPHHLVVMVPETGERYYPNRGFRRVFPNESVFDHDPLEATSWWPVR